MSRQAAATREKAVDWLSEIERKCRVFLYSIMVQTEISEHKFTYQLFMSDIFVISTYNDVLLYLGGLRFHANSSYMGLFVIFQDLDI